MFFKNLSLYRFPDGVVDHDKLEAALVTHQLRAIGPLELKCSGFVKCLGDFLLYTQGDFCICRLAVTEKVLPPAVINEELAKRVAEIHDEDGRKVGAKERKRIKDEILTDFLARAFSQTRASSAYFDFKNGWLVIDTATRKVAEFFISSLREALGSFPCTPLTPEESTKVLMTDWLARGALPELLALGDECTLKESAEAGASWSGKRTDLETDEVREHLKSGMQVERLGLQFDERLTFTLGDDLTVRKLKFLDIVVANVHGDDSAAEALSTFTLMTLELQRLLATLAELFKVPRAPALSLDGGATAPEMRASKKRGGVLDRATDAQLDAALERDPGLCAAVKDVKRERAKAKGGNLEAAVRITAKLCEMRDHVKQVLGAKYDERMRQNGFVIRERAEREKKTELSVATALFKEGGALPEAWMAAYAELAEPPAALGFAKKLEKRMRAKGFECSVQITNGARPRDLINGMDQTKLSQSERDWLASGRRGMASETMFAGFHALENTDHFHPMDAGDFGRCRLLLEAVPEFQHRLGELAHLSPVWERLVQGWPDLCSTMDAECPNWRDADADRRCPQTYEAMKFYIGRPE